MIIINIELKDRSRTKEFFHKLHSKSEDLLFSTVQKLPEKLIPHWLMDLLEEYLDKRIKELKQESIRMTWKSVHLKKAVSEIHNRQQTTKKAPSDD